MVLCVRGPACHRARQQAHARPHVHQLKPLRSTHHSTRHNRCKAFKEPREELSAEQVEEWERCVAKVVAMGLEEAKAESILKESYGWPARGVSVVRVGEVDWELKQLVRGACMCRVSQKYWKRRMMQEPATESQLQETCEFLKAKTGLSDADLGDVVSKFPQIFGCGEVQLQYAVDMLDKSWRIKGTMLTSCVKRNPTLLGCVIDCYGDCAGDCERCWQRF